METPYIEPVLIAVQELACGLVMQTLVPSNPKPPKASYMNPENFVDSLIALATLQTPQARLRAFGEPSNLHNSWSCSPLYQLEFVTGQRCCRCSGWRCHFDNRSAVSDSDQTVSRKHRYKRAWQLTTEPSHGMLRGTFQVQPGVAEQMVCTSMQPMQNLSCMFTTPYQHRLPMVTS